MRTNNNVNVNNKLSNNKKKTTTTGVKRSSGRSFVFYRRMEVVMKK